MLAIEQITRPVAFSDPLNRRRLVASNVKIDVPVASITWGDAGDIAAAHEVEGIPDNPLNFQVINCDDRFTELSRKEDFMRIENPLDSEDYVNLKRPRELIFDRKSENQLNTQNYNKTTIWKTAVETATFSTVDFNSKKCASRFSLTPPND